MVEVEDTGVRAYNDTPLSTKVQVNPIIQVSLMCRVQIHKILWRLKKGCLIAPTTVTFLTIILVSHLNVPVHSFKYFYQRTIYCSNLTLTTNAVLHYTAQEKLKFKGYGIANKMLTCGVYLVLTTILQQYFGINNCFRLINNKNYYSLLFSKIVYMKLVFI